MVSSDVCAKTVRMPGHRYTLIRISILLAEDALRFLTAFTVVPEEVDRTRCIAPRYTPTAAQNILRNHGHFTS